MADFVRFSCMFMLTAPQVLFSARSLSVVLLSTWCQKCDYTILWSQHMSRGSYQDVIYFSKDNRLRINLLGPLGLHNEVWLYHSPSGVFLKWLFQYHVFFLLVRLETRFKRVRLDTSLRPWSWRIRLKLVSISRIWLTCLVCMYFFLPVIQVSWCLLWTESTEHLQGLLVRSRDFSQATFIF